MRDAGTGAESIWVRVSLFGALRRFAADPREGVCDLQLPSGATLVAVREALGIPASAEITAGVNGNQAEADIVLRDGDRVVLFNALSGGDGSRRGGINVRRRPP